MTVTATSREAYEKRYGKLNTDLDAVYCMIEQLGPTHNNRILEALQQAQKKLLRDQRRKTEWVSNNVWPRVNNLINIQRLVVDMGRYRGRWKNRNVSFNFRRVVGDMREPDPAQWEKVEPVPKKHKPPTKKTFRQQVQDRAFNRVGGEQEQLNLAF